MELFSVDAAVIKKKKNCPRKHRKMLSKVAHNRPNFLFQYWLGCPNGPKTEILYHQKPLNAGLDI